MNNYVSIILHYQKNTNNTLKQVIYSTSIIKNFIRLYCYKHYSKSYKKYIMGLNS